MNKTNTIQAYIEASWDDDDEFLTTKQRQKLEGRGWLADWVPIYFEDLVSRYQGSCTSLAWKDTLFLDEFDLFEELDNIQFECNCCGWWYETHEQGEAPEGEQWCQECCEEQLDDEFNDDEDE